jgi:hypothetical protein
VPVNTGIVLIVVFLVVVFALSFPTRGRALRAYTPARGPHPLLRPFLALGRWRRELAKRRKRRHLRVHER